MLLTPDFIPIELTADFIAGLLIGAGSASSAWGLALYVWLGRRDAVEVEAADGRVYPILNLI